MRSLWLCSLVVVAALAGWAEQRSYKEGDLLIQFTRGVDVQKFAEQYHDMQLRPVKLLSRRMNIWLFEYDPRSRAASGALASVQGSNVVLNAQFNHYVTERSVIPNDPQFAQQWALNNTGQTGGTPDADIDAPEAWEIATGGLTSLGDTIVIAVVDGGVDLTHPDLFLFKNKHEIPGNGIDDDGNGYIDDYHGWNAYNSNGNVPSNNHGTHVSGIAAARSNNGVGVAGVNWNAKVLPIAGSSGTESIVVEAYGYALEMRARYNETNGDSGAFVVVTNSSFGVDFGNPANFPIWAAMYDSMGAVGILSCAATMNRNENVDIVGDMPTACTSPWLITVTNTTNTDAKNSGAAYGLTTIDLGAPGTSILSTTSGGGYGLLTGTSMATPTVAGAVALMFAAANPALIQAYRNDPAATALQIKDWLLQGVDTIPSLQGITVSGGRLNIHKALQLVLTYADTLDPNAPTNVSAYSDYQTPTSISLAWTNPTTLVNGQPIGPFVIRVLRNGAQVAEVDSPGTSYIDTNLVNGTLYTYDVMTRLTANDSLSPAVRTSWIAGGSKIPGRPTGLTVSGTSATGYKLRWTNPSRQMDGTPLNDLDGIRVYRNGSLLTTLTRTSADTARADSTTDSPSPGLYWYYLRAIDNDSPINESATSDTAFTPLEVPFSDTFPTTGIPNTAIWNATNVDVNNRGLNPPSAPNAMNLNGNPVGNGDVVECLPIDMSGAAGTGVSLSYYYQPRGTGDNPEIADSLIVELRNSLGQWIAARKYPGLNSADPTPPFAFQTIGIDAVPPGAGATFFYNGFKFRFRSLGTVGAFDDWFVDDVFFGIPSGVPVMVLNTTQVRDTVLVGLVDTSSYAFSVSNTNPTAAPLVFAVTESPAVSWLSVSPDSASVPAASSRQVRVRVDFASVPPGTYSTLLVVSGNDPSNPSDTVSVGFVVNPAPVISVEPDSLAASLDVGNNTATDTLRIHNLGQGTLVWELTEVSSGMPPDPGSLGYHLPGPDSPKGADDGPSGPPVVRGQGGPDAFGYRWIDSDEPGGPVFGWIDISTTGSVLDSASAWVPTGSNRPGDEGYFPVTLPFGFSFYGTTYTTAYIGTNGTLSFQPPPADFFTNAAIPTAGGTIDNFIAGFWDDLEVRAAGRVYYGTSGNNFVVQFHNMPRFASGVSNYTFQFVLKPGGQILLQYLSMGTAGGTLISSSIGIENQTGTIGLQVVFNAAYMHNNLAILFSRGMSWLETSATSGVVGPGSTQDVIVTYNSAGLPLGIYRGTLEISSNDPVTSMVGIPVRLDVGTVDVGEPRAGVPQAYAMAQNYPNPFNPSTQIEYELPQASYVRLVVFNILGQQVVTLVDEERPAGYHTVVWDGTNGIGARVTSSVYFYRIDAVGTDGVSSFTSIRKTLLLK